MNDNDRLRWPVNRMIGFEPPYEGGTDLMRRYRPQAIVAVALLIGLAALGGGLANAEKKGAQISGVETTRVWGGVYRLSATIRADKRRISEAEYRIGSEMGPLFAVDGLFDSDEEMVETYLDLSKGEGISIRARIGGAWIDWQTVDADGDFGQPSVGCVTTSELPGRGEWHRGPVAVDCSPMIAAADAEGIEYSLNFAEWQPAEASFVVEEDGVHWIQIRTISPDGIAGLPSTFTVAIDSVAPIIRVTPPATTLMSRADQLYLDFEAEDEISGVALAVGDLNGEQELMSGMPIDLWRLPLGWHSLSVYARDHAGNMAVAMEPIDLEITTDLGSLSRLVQLFGVQGKLDSYTGLRQRLTTLLRTAGEAEPGEAVGHLTDFIDRVQQGMAERLIFAAEGQALIEDAIYIMERIDDDLGSEPPDWWD